MSILSRIQSKWVRKRMRWRFETKSYHRWTDRLVYAALPKLWSKKIGIPFQKSMSISWIWRRGWDKWLNMKHISRKDWKLSRNSKVIQAYIASLLYLTGWWKRRKIRFEIIQIIWSYHLIPFQAKPNWNFLEEVWSFRSAHFYYHPCLYYG